MNDKARIAELERQIHFWAGYLNIEITRARVLGESTFIDKMIKLRGEMLAALGTKDSSTVKPKEE